VGMRSFLSLYIMWAFFLSTIWNPSKVPLPLWKLDFGCIYTWFFFIWQSH
jgi:hypothetical protein